MSTPAERIGELGRDRRAAVSEVRERRAAAQAASRRTEAARAATAPAATAEVQRPGRAGWGPRRGAGTTEFLVSAGDPTRTPAPTRSTGPDHPDEDYSDRSWLR